MNSEKNTQRRLVMDQALLLAMAGMRMAPLVGLIAGGALVGCARGGVALKPPRIDAAAAGAEAIRQFDADADGALGGDELDRVPGIRSALDKYDANGDNRVTADEIAARIASWQIVPVAALQLNCSVRLARRPLAGATVELAPEAFLGNALYRSVGVTDQSGFAFLSMDVPQDEAPALSGVQCGLYKVRVTKTSAGKQIVPPRFNVDAELGLEVAPDSACVRDGLRLEL